MLQVAGWMIAEAAIGLATGLAVAFLIEAVTFAAQAISTQAGFAYASTIDPNTEADSTVLLTPGAIDRRTALLRDGIRSRAADDSVAQPGNASAGRVYGVARQRGSAGDARLQHFFHRAFIWRFL